jgi:Outer membrane protein beta-barrel domain
VFKIAAALLVLACFVIIPGKASAQLIPQGNVYLGGSIGSFETLTDGRTSMMGWNGGAEWILRPHVGVAVDASGYYRSGITSYDFLVGPRVSATFGKARPFAQLLVGVTRVTENGLSETPFAVGGGGGVDYKIFHNFSWRVQGDYIHTHYLNASQNNLRVSTGLVFRF